MRANELTQAERHTVITHDSWIEGPRWAFGPLWLDRFVMEANDELVAKGWKRIEIVSQREEKSFLRKGITFTLRGEAYGIGFFLEALESAVNSRKN